MAADSTFMTTDTINQMKNTTSSTIDDITSEGISAMSESEAGWSPVYKWVLPCIAIIVFCVTVVLLYKFPSPSHETRSFIKRWTASNKKQRCDPEEGSTSKTEKRQSEELLNPSK